MLQEAFLLALKKALKTKGINYKMLADHLEISEASVKRIFSQGSLSLDRIAAILEWVDLSFLDIARLMANRPDEQRQELTIEQEEVLAKNNEFAAFFHLILFGTSIKDIRRTGQFSEAAIERFKSSLCSLGLGVAAVQGELQLLVGRGVKWQPMGPLVKAYGKKLKQEFLAGNFEGVGFYNSFATRSLTSASQAIIKKKIRALMEEIDTMAMQDNILSPSETLPTAFYTAFRPFYYLFGVDPIEAEDR